MACCAIDRNVALRVAAQAIAHIQIYGTYSRGLLHEVAVTIRTGHRRADVRRMIEPDVSRGAIFVNTHPGNVFAARLVTGHFLDFGAIFSDDQMTSHAEFHAGDSRIGSLVYSGVADLAL